VRGIWQDTLAPAYWSVGSAEEIDLTKCLRERGGNRWAWGLAAFFAILICSSGCDIQRRKSDAELGLNPQQAAGRKIYDQYCDRCHEPYSTRGRKGPGLQGVFKNKYLSVSGLPANDERVLDIIRLGRKEMPGFSQTLSDQDIQNLLAYMHTL
jgi:mono/diheme cytochrome c family protein